MKLLHFLVLLILTGLFALPSASQSGREHCVMFYNAENLFHPSDDSVSADDDFTPAGVRRWNFYRYNRKIAAICKVILAVNGWEPPDAVCLSEIENREVLDDIRYHPLMLGQQYRVLHRDSPDHRGIDVGILYRADRLDCLDTAWIEIRDAEGTLVPTREILSASFRLKSTGGTVLICANHWTSKYGGAVETEDKRIMQSQLLGEYIQAKLGRRNRGPGTRADADTLNFGSSVAPIPGVIAGGDLNDLSGSAPVQMLTDTFHLEKVIPGVTSNAEKKPATGSERRYHIVLRNKLTAQSAVLDDAMTAPASYKYQGNWGSIDHVFVGGALHARDCRARVFSHPLLLEEDTKYTGKKPFRTYTGFSYHGGFSDHLPLLIHFVLPEERTENAGDAKGTLRKEVSREKVRPNDPEAGSPAVSPALLPF